jgi:hypothetical protein
MMVQARRDNVHPPNMYTLFMSEHMTMGHLTGSAAAAFVGKNPFS